MSERFRIMTLLVLLGLLAGLLTLATWADGSSDALQPNARQVDIAVWSATFCRGLANTRLYIDSGPDSFSAVLATEVTDRSSAAIAKARAVAGIAAVVRAVKASTVATRRVGTPRIDNGAAVAEAFLRSNAALQARFEQEAALAAALSTTNVATFHQQWAALRFDFQNRGQGTYSDTQRGYRLGGKKLEQSFRNDETCRLTIASD
jgi:hypothetical protein